MSCVAYVNGRYIRHAAAGVSINDRAFLFADGVYEVIEVFGGKLIDEDGHLLRLARSARELRLRCPGRGKRAAAHPARTRRAQSRRRRPCLSPGHARRGETRPYLPQGRDALDSGRFRPSGRPGGGGGAGARRNKGHFPVGHPMEKAGHQDHQPFAQCARQAAGQGRRRLRGLAGGRAGFCHRGLVEQRLDRGRRGRLGHPSRGLGDSRRNHPRPAVPDRRRQGAEDGGAAVLAAKRLFAPERPSSAAPRPSFCRWWRSTARKSAPARPALSPWDCARLFTISRRRRLEKHRP